MMRPSGHGVWTPYLWVVRVLNDVGCRLRVMTELRVRCAGSRVRNTRAVFSLRPHKGSVLWSLGPQGEGIAGSGGVAWGWMRRMSTVSQDVKATAQEQKSIPQGRGVECRVMMGDRPRVPRLEALMGGDRGVEREAQRPNSRHCRVS